MLSMIVLGEKERSVLTTSARKTFKLSRKTIVDGRKKQQKLVFHLAFYRVYKKKVGKSEIALSFAKRLNVRCFVLK